MIKKSRKSSIPLSKNSLMPQQRTLQRSSNDIGFEQESNDKCISGLYSSGFMDIPLNPIALLQKKENLKFNRKISRENSIKKMSTQASSIDSSIQRMKIGDSELWATARRLVNADEKHPNYYGIVPIIVKLLREFDESDISHALGTISTEEDTRSLFSDEEKGRTVIEYYSKGLNSRIIAADGRGCDDHISLGKMLELSLQIQNKMGNSQAVPSEVRQDLIERYPIDIIAYAAVDIPGLLNIISRASVLMDHLVAGGSMRDAVRASNFESNNLEVLKEILETLRKFCSVPGLQKLDQEQLNAILTERHYLVSEMLWKNAVGLVSSESGQADAVKNLEQHRDFGYVREFRARTEGLSSEKGKELIESKSKNIRQESEGEREIARLNVESDARGKLSRKEKNALGLSEDIKGKIKEKPEMFPDEWNKAKEKLESEISKVSFDSIRKIDAQETEKLRNIVEVEAPAEEKRVFDLYQSYFARAGFHPYALKALDKSKNDTELALSLIESIKSAPITRDLLLEECNFEEICRIKNYLLNVLGAIMKEGVTSLAIKNFAQNDEFILLLAKLHEVGLESQRINDVAPLLVSLRSFVEMTPDLLVPLLRRDAPNQIIEMSKAFRIGVYEQAGFLSKIRPHASSVNDLISILTLCKEFGWKADEVFACLTKVKLDSDLNALTNAVYAEHLQRTPKEDNFFAWIDAVGQLAEKGHISVYRDYDWEKLPGKNVTYERRYTVMCGSQHAGFFYVHKHPQAEKAGVGNPNASVLHFKPTREGSIRRYYDDSPESTKRMIYPVK